MMLTKECVLESYNRWRAKLSYKTKKMFSEKEIEAAKLASQYDENLLRIAAVMAASIRRQS